MCYCCVLLIPQLTTTNNRLIINPFPNKLSLRYPQLYNGQDLRKLMDKESSGHYGTALEFCALGPAVAECAMIQKATKGMGTSEHLLYSIIMGRSNEEIAFLKTTYYDTYTDDLGRIVSKELGGDLRKLAISCLQVNQSVTD